MGGVSLPCAWISSLHTWGVVGVARCIFLEFCILFLFVFFGRSFADVMVVVGEKRGLGLYTILRSFNDISHIILYQTFPRELDTVVLQTRVLCC
jgi:hypothetical protein